MAVPQKLKIELPYDPPVPLLGIYLEKTITQKDTCTLMFTAAIYNSQDTELKCPTTEGWIKILHKYNEILLSHKNEGHSAICRNVDGPRDCHTERSQKEKMSY